MPKKKVEEPTNDVPVCTDKDPEPEDSAAVKALKDLDEKFCAIELECEREVTKLRKKFQQEQAPILEERTKILSDTTGCSADDQTYGTPACRGFWTTAFRSCEFSQVIESYDEDVLDYLVDLKKMDLDEEHEEAGLKIEFIFKENPYFTNTTLWVECHTDFDKATYQPWKDVDCIATKGSPIDWKPGKNVTVSVETKKVKGGGAKKAKQKGKEKVEPRQSFFRFLFPDLKLGDPVPACYGGGDDEDDDDDDEGNDQTKEILEDRYGLCEEISEGVIPYAVRFYTGEAAGDDSDDDFDESGEESDGDDDDDDDESEEEPLRGRAKPKSKKAGGHPAPDKQGAKQEECKQQ